VRLERQITHDARQPRCLDVVDFMGAV